VLRELVSGAAHDSSGFGRYQQLSNLGAWQDKAGSSISNGLRAHAGGQLPAIPETDDPVVAALLSVARDVWPTLLIPPPRPGPATFWSSMPLGMFGHPASLDAAKEFLSDSSLRQLFPKAPTGGGLKALTQEQALQMQSSWMSNSGRGGTHQLFTLLGMLVTNARLWALVEAGDESWDGLMQALPGVLAAVRRLATGEMTDVPRLIGFLGLSLPEGLAVKLPHGRLLMPRPADRTFLLPESESATAVLLTTFALRLVDVRPWEPGDEPHFPRPGWEQVTHDNQKIQREIDLTRLAALLSSPDDRIWSLSELASLIVDPTAPGGVSQWTGRKYGVRNAELDQAGGDRLLEWWTTIKQRHPETLDIAMRRAISAAGERLDPVDGFVDAVVAWENCFGTSVETMFRVTGAIATLLEPGSAKARLALQHSLKRAYEKRSRVVHGAIHLSPQEAAELRDSALEIAIKCLRRLYTDRTDLLNLKSEERSTRLMLG